VQENLQQVGEKEASKARQIDEDIRRRMEKSSLNREKHHENQEKEIRMLDDNWKRKMDAISRKNKEQSKEAFRKAVRMRKEAEEFWVKKKSYTAREALREDSSPPGKADGPLLPVPSYHLQIPNSAHNNIPTGLSRK
jgi:hypothetical protein